MTRTVGEQEQRTGILVFTGNQAFVVEGLDNAGALFSGLDYARQLNNLSQRKTVGGVALYGGSHVGDTVDDGIVLRRRLGQGCTRVDFNLDAAVGVGFNSIGPALENFLMDRGNGRPEVGETQGHVGGLSGGRQRQGGCSGCDRLFQHCFHYVRPLVSRCCLSWV